MFEQEIHALQDELFDIYKDLHMHPERGFTEYRTADIVAQHLKSWGLDVTTEVALTGVVGVLDSGRPGKTLMIRADMDCLAIQEETGLPYQSVNEGLAHACGHDAHTTMLLGAAKVLSQHKDSFVGKIKFVFQPNEEGYPDDHPIVQKLHGLGYFGIRPGEAGLGGAGYMIQEGVMAGVDACMALHVQPNLPLGTAYIAKREACASTDFIRITLQGKGGHGSLPQNAIDPVPAMAQLIQAIHILPTREADGAEKWVFHIGNVYTPGSIWSAVADKAVIELGYRAFNDETRRLFTRRIRELTESIAAAYRCTPIIEHSVGYAPTINNEKLSAQVAQSCRKILGEDNVIYSDTPNMTAEDCGEYFRVVPGTLLWLGIAHTDNVPALHNPRFCVPADALPLGVQVHVENALSYLSEN